jgi:hypothetical protein
MLWPIVLPFKLTFLIILTVVTSLTLLSPLLKWKQSKVFGISFGLSCILFIPTCAGIATLLDPYRFREFKYESVGDINDFRAERYLPPLAYDITIMKNVAGNRSKYSISENDLHKYIESLWVQFGHKSAVSREDLDRTISVTEEEIRNLFGDLGWPILRGAVELNSPMEGDGGGATYFFHKESEIVYQRTSYW